MVNKGLPETMSLIRDNIVETKNPLAVSAKENGAWANGLDLPKKGPLLFYTGGEYQLLPFIDSLMSVMEVVDPGSRLFSWMMGMRDLVHKTGFTPEKLFASVFASDKNRYFGINRKAALILRQLGYDISYNGEQEIYSGALLHEMGFKEALSFYAKEISTFIKQSGAETIVCLSPHAAEMFRYVYPEYKDFPDIEVKTFPNMLWEKRELLPTLKRKEPIVIHDSCRLAREMGVVTELRDVFDALSVTYVEPMRSGVWTTCCGGPIKMTYPDLSHKLAIQRCDELLSTGCQEAIVACPFCLSALSGCKGSLVITDLVELVSEGYGL